MAGLELIDWEQFQTAMLVSAKRVRFLICGRGVCPIVKAHFLKKLPLLLSQLRERGILEVRYIPGQDGQRLR